MPPALLPKCCDAGWVWQATFDKFGVRVLNVCVPPDGTNAYLYPSYLIVPEPKK